jgi:hypothetical protein
MAACSDEVDYCTANALGDLVSIAFPDADADRRQAIITQLVAVMQRHRDTLPEE